MRRAGRRRRRRRVAGGRLQVRRCRDRRSWCRCRGCRGRILTLTICDLMVLLSSDGLLGDGGAAEIGDAREHAPQARGRRSRAAPDAAGARRRPSTLVSALRPTPSSMPVKIRSSVAAKYQVKTSIAVNSTTPMPPTEIAQARSVRVLGRSSLEMVTSGPFRGAGGALFREILPGIKPRPCAGLKRPSPAGANAADAQGCPEGRICAKIALPSRDPFC